MNDKAFQYHIRTYYPITNSYGVVIDLLSVLKIIKVCTDVSTEFVAIDSFIKRIERE